MIELIYYFWFEDHIDSLFIINFTAFGFYILSITIKFVEVQQIDKRNRNRNNKKQKKDIIYYDLCIKILNLKAKLTHFYKFMRLLKKKKKIGFFKITKQLKRIRIQIYAVSITYSLFNNDPRALTKSRIHIEIRFITLQSNVHLLNSITKWRTPQFTHIFNLL